MERVKLGPITEDEAREEFAGDIEHYLGGGEMLPPGSGLSGETDAALARIAGAVLSGQDPADAVAAAWAVFDELNP